MPKGVEHDENLLGYLLDALDRDARRAVEAHLRAHPDARARLAELRELLAPLDAEAETPEPPAGLAESALAHIAAHTPTQPSPTRGGRAGRGGLPAAPPPSPRQSGAFTRRHLRRVDVAVAGLMLVLTAGLCLTWLARQWRDYQILACQNNLHGLWTALQVYADERSEDGAFPRVEDQPPRNFAGVFIPILADAGALGANTITVCPARGGRPPAACTMDQLADLARDRPDEYLARTRDLGGDYAYTLGYRRGDDLVGLNRDCGDLLPILADRPRDAGAGNSPNHDGAGQNVLYIGGQVRWCTGPNVGVGRDDIYRNLKYQVLAGECEFDSVLGPSDASSCVAP